ncbi:lysophospholipid acyltransferase family protein [Caloranaerobacter sp. DY30410]|uniref:lysophospholipid acyltransferase family protein n=1 Tax=Caloranaerobacter sp. DY30410 TaxID=3238305 RepID=UPI003CFE7BEC
MSFYNFAKKTLSLFMNTFFRIEVIGKHNFTEDKLIICSNHISILDPILIGIISPRKIYFMAKKELFKNKILNKIITNLGAFPVDREKGDISAIKKSLKVLNEGNVLGIFLEGTRVKDENIENAKPGVAMIAIKSKCNVLPIYIDANYKLFSKIKIIIGEQISFEEFYDQKLNIDDYKKISQNILKRIYALK